MPRKTVHNQLTTREDVADVNERNIDLLQDFLTYMRSLQRSAGTIAGYKNDLLIFFVWIKDNAHNKAFSELTKRDIIHFQNWMIDENKSSPSRVRRIKAAISSLSNYIENILDDDQDYRGFRSIVRKIDNPPLQPVREKTVWDDDELQNLLDELVRRGKVEQACFLALAMYSGRRKAELCRFKVTDFDEDKVVCDNSLYKSAPILTKGMRYINCYVLKKKFDPYLQLWLKERYSRHIKSEWLFFDHDDHEESLKISTVNSWGQTFCDITDKNFYWHSLRHFFCTELVRAGIPDGVIVDIIGWKSSDMLKIYDDTPKEEKISAFFKDGDIVSSDKKELSDL